MSDGALPDCIPIRLPLVIRKSSDVMPTDAFLLEGQQSESALRLYGALADQSRRRPSIFEVACGLLIETAEPTRMTWPGASRLRRLCPRLFVPIDAELQPALLQDELAGLTRDRGLVFLPGSRVLMFEPGQPVPLSMLLEVRRATTPAWEAPPEPPTRADRIEEIVFEPLVPPIETVLEEGNEDVGNEEIRPPDTDPARKALGGATMGIGRGMIWLGQTLGIQGLAKLGSEWVGSALSMVPRLSEGLLGKQEGALRDLLREFREGNVEEALRRALPLGKGSERGASVAQSADLPHHETRYSLPDILGSASTGSSSYWFGGFDLQQELTQEYRKAAEKAARRGDYRRAAFIYAKLLEDYRLAATVLMQGGLPRDAALIYLEKLNDRAAAARAFEAAGDFDRALTLYRGLEQFEAAGDLLTRLGEPDQALEAYREAADLLVYRESNPLRAGELIQRKARRSDIATVYFQSGWETRPWNGAVGCAIALAQYYTTEGDLQGLGRLTTEADDFFEQIGDDANAGRFYNELARLAEFPTLASMRDDLRDQARLGLAGTLRRQLGTRQVTAGLVNSLFGVAQGWPVGLVHDAEVAAQGMKQQSIEHSEPHTKVTRRNRAQIADGTIETIALASEVVPGSGYVFLGMEHGVVIRFNPATGESNVVARYELPVRSISIGQGGRMLTVLWHDKYTGRTILAAYLDQGNGRYKMTEGRREHAKASTLSLPTLLPGTTRMDLTAYWNGGQYLLLRGPRLLPQAEVVTEDQEELTGNALLVDSPHWQFPRILEFGLPGYWNTITVNQESETVPVPWTLHTPSQGTLNWTWHYYTPRKLAIIGLGPHGVVHYTLLMITEDGIQHRETHSTELGDLHYQAVNFIRPGLIIALKQHSVSWLRPSATRLHRVATTQFDPSAPVIGAFPSRSTNSLVIVGSDGWIERVPLLRD